MEIQIFKAQRNTLRFRQNQKVFVVAEFGNHLWLVHKWRGKGRYVKCVISKWKDTASPGYSSIIGAGGLKKVDLPDDFVLKLCKLWGIDDGKPLIHD
jgi:uncharacterized protein with WD repeat